MSNLDTLGQRHKQLQGELANVRAELAEEIRAERNRGATLVQLMQRSGYSSIETIRQILDPGIREKVNQDRRSA